MKLLEIWGNCFITINLLPITEGQHLLSEKRAVCKLLNILPLVTTFNYLTASNMYREFQNPVTYSILKICNYSKILGLKKLCDRK